jgi:hypothetical protein
MESYGILWNPVESCGIRGNSGNPRNPKESMEFMGIHGNPWEFRIPGFRTFPLDIEPVVAQNNVL